MGVNKLGLIRVIELAIAIACIGLHTQSFTNNFNCDTVSAIAFGGFIIILVGAAFGHFNSTGFEKRIDIFFCLVGCGLFIAAGALNIDIYRNGWKTQARDYGLAKGGLAIVGGLIFLIDALFTWRD